MAAKQAWRPALHQQTVQQQKSPGGCPGLQSFNRCKRVLVHVSKSADRGAGTSLVLVHAQQHAQAALQTLS